MAAGEGQRNDAVDLSKIRQAIDEEDYESEIFFAHEWLSQLVSEIDRLKGEFPERGSKELKEDEKNQRDMDILDGFRG